MRTSTLARFKAQRGPDGKRWEPSQRVKEGGGLTLSQSGGLKNSIKTTAAATGFAVGTNKIYASTHQLGATNRTIRAKTSKGLRFRFKGEWISKQQVTVNIPARPYLGLSDDDLEAIKTTLEKELKED